jgi:chemotaxis family two-component system sensor kinase Cph1
LKTTLSAAAIAALVTCAHEPIHIPGAIQPHGCLLAFDRQSFTVVQVSANVEAFLGYTPEQILGNSIMAALPTAAQQSLRGAMAKLDVSEVNPLCFEACAQSLSSVLHRIEDLVVLEIELAASEETVHWRVDIDRAFKRICETVTLEPLTEATVKAIRSLSGFDRVVVYRFATDNSGEVVAESKTDALDPYGGLHFPASDIPPQARALYLRNWIRCIPEARYQSVPLVGATGTVPLDLSHSMLRSVSPVHLDYLANMGVRSSMSVSLIVEGRLWGLISCGHPTPHNPSYRVQRACETIGRMVSLQIGALQASEFQRRQAGKAGTIQRLVAAMRSSGHDVLGGLATEPALLLNLLRASGAAIVTGTEVVRIGSCPQDIFTRQVAALVMARAENGIFSSQELSQEDERWEACIDDACGVLAIVLPTPSQPCVLWFRPEFLRDVSWGGKPKDFSSPDMFPLLTPKRSFEVWKEEVRGQSLEWEAIEIHIAADLRRFAIEIDLARQVVKEHEAVQARDDLVAVVSHDLRNPMSVVAMQAVLIQRFLAQDVTEASKRLRASAQTIQRAAERMNSLLQDLLDLAKIEAGRFEIVFSEQTVAHIVEDACELLQAIAQAKEVTLRFEGAPQTMISVDPERIFQVLSNLIGNAVKFSPPGSSIRIGAKTVGDRCEFFVSDEGAGIAASELSRIFDRYWQAKPSQGVGAGLGLYIAKGIVEAHGGTIHAQSSLGAGTTFFFTVPLAAGADGASELGAPAISQH